MEGAVEATDDGAVQSLQSELDGEELSAAGEYEPRSGAPSLLF